MSDVKASDRKDHGMQGGKYPCGNEHECISAINLRHNGKGTSPEGVLSHVASEAAALRKAGKISPAAYERIQKKIAQARATDKGAH